ncbi:MAG: hypothetical protein HC822_21895 [Oscillochloris sp.]|nr:hypothetical protein [Oscillochloris sp.]
MQSLPIRLIVFFALGLLVLAGSPDTHTAQAQSEPPAAVCVAPIEPVTLTNPTVLTDCTEAALRAALANGGQITFNCGPNPIEIDITAPLVTSATEDIVLDGGGLVTLNGNDTTRILEKPFTPGSQDDKTLGNDITLQNIRFINGRAPAAASTRDGDARGGAIWVTSPGTRLHIINVIFEDNATTSVNDEDNQGGAVYAANIYETVIVGSTFRNNVAGSGGAFGGIATGLLVYNSSFVANQAADSSSGGIVRGHGGALHLDGVTNSFNPDSNRVVTVCGSTFDGNTAVRGGGAIKVTISDNKGTKATYDRSLFRNNRLVGVPPTEGSGGAIYHIEDDFDGGISEDNIEIRDSTFEGNYAYRQGGAAWILVRGRGRIVNSTFSANEAAERGSNRVGQGGALILDRGVIDVIHSTFVKNFATFQGGAIHAGGDGDPERVITLVGSLFYDNRLDPTHSDPVTSEFQGYHTNRPLESGGLNLQFPRAKTPDFNNDVNNLISKDTAAIIFSDPLVDELADNGGPTPTFALPANSPAVDAIDGACPANDQRGMARPQGPACDIGAYERVAELLVRPGLIAVGSEDVTLTVEGVGFTPSSVVRWNNTDLATTYVSASRLTAVVPAALLTEPGTAQVRVSGVDLPAQPVRIAAVQMLYLPLVLQ